MGTVGGIGRGEADGSQTPGGAEPPLVFIVEDDPGTLDLLREIAEEGGWSVVSFTRLRDLRASLSRGRPTLIILDDDLPDGRGGDIVRELRDDPRMAPVRVLVCTAAHPMRQAEIGGWAPVVAKPFDIDEIERYLVAAARHAARSAYRRAG